MWCPRSARLPVQWGVLVCFVFALLVGNGGAVLSRNSSSARGAVAASRLANSIDSISNHIIDNSNNPSACSERQFWCASGECIHNSFVCDGEPDCTDGSDENPKECSDQTKCDGDKFRCKNGRCIPKRWQCDKEMDCSDGSDEDPHNCQNKTCSAEEFTCKSNEGECIPLAWLCDETKDCTDGSDEFACNETCRADEFTCNNGKCIQKRWRCDGDNDCEDNSDEHNCPPAKCSDTSFKCADGVCISAKWRCDGDFDCADGSDERGCNHTVHMNRACVPIEYQCDDRITCIHRSWLCDGGHDCPNGDDEKPPNCLNVTCRPDQFQCKDNLCIPGHLMCSGKAECADGSDEINCATPLRRCDPKTEFDCGGGECIPNSKVCDTKIDCPAGQDEPVNKCGIDECKFNNGGCEHSCVNTPASFYCECQKGFKLVNNRTCTDINECVEEGSCSQLCINEIGTFKCECNAGYQRDPRDHTRCKAIEGHASLLFARRHDIRKIALDHNEMTSIVNETKSATALDFVFRTGMIFWSDVAEQKIYKAPIDEGNEKSVVVRDQSVTADGLAVDWIYSHIYYSDTKKCTIEVTNFDGNMGKVLVRDDLEIPRAIALDPIDGYMYWTDWGASPRIERAGMDGTHRQAIVSSNVQWPNGLTLDLERKRVFWVDAKLNVISSCNYDGSNRKIVLYSADTLRHPFSITTFEDSVYWTDWDKAAVFRANKFTGENVTSITPPGMLQHPMTIHIYHPYRQPDGINHCQAVNGHCSHLCLPAPQINEHSPRISCACPTGLKLMNDGLMCVEDDSKIVTPSTSRKDDHSHIPHKNPAKGSVPYQANNSKGSSKDALVTNHFGTTRTGISDTATGFGVIVNHDRNQSNHFGTGDTQTSTQSIKNAQNNTHYHQKMIKLCTKLQNKLPWIGVKPADNFQKDHKPFESPNASNFPSSHIPSDTELSSPSPNSRTPLIYWNHTEFREYYHLLKLNSSDGIDEAPFVNQVNYIRWLCAKLTTASTRPSGNNSVPDGTLILHNEDVDSGIVAGIFIAVAIAVTIVIGLIAYCLYRHYVHRNLTSMNFDNPVYRKTTEDQFSLEKNLPARMYPSTVDEETREPLNKPGTNEFV